MNVVMYSCVSSGYDDKQEDGRIYIPPDDRFVTDRMNAKFPKILSHKIEELQTADFTVWADSNLILKISPEELVDLWGFPKVGVFKHKKSDIAGEIMTCKKRKLDNRLRLEYHKDKKGLLGCCFLIVRENCPKVNMLNERWWAEISAGSSRDQISFPYTLGTIATYFPLPNRNHTSNDIFTRVRHKKGRKKWK